MLYQIFHKAETNDLVRKNPVRFADKMRSREPTKRKDAFTAEEVKLLMEKLPKDRIGISIRLLLGTGMRSQELLALEPRHIAEDGSMIQIRQAINVVKGTATVGQPKSRDSYRDVPIPPSLRWCAIQLRTTNRTFVWEAGKKDQPCNPSYFRDKFKAAIGEIEGVRVLTPHSCRHTHVSQLQPSEAKNTHWTHWPQPHSGQIVVKSGSESFHPRNKSSAKTEKSIENQWFSRLIWWR